MPLRSVLLWWFPGLLPHLACVACQKFFCLLKVHSPYLCKLYLLKIKKYNIIYFKNYFILFNIMRIFAMKLSFWKGPGSFCEAVLKSGIRGVLLMRLFLKLKYNVASCFYSDLTSLCNTKIGPWYQLDHCENFQWRFDGLRSQKRSFWIEVTLSPFWKGK